MYCTIKYTECTDKLKEAECSSVRTIPINSAKSYQQSLKSVASKTSIVQENKTMLVNPDCYVQILLDYISLEIQFDKNSNFDLCDETGRLLKIKSLKPWEYATTLLESQKTYVVVVCEQDETGQYKSIEPILNRNSKDYFDMSMKLKKYVPSVRRFSSDSKRSRRRSADDISSKGSSSLRITPRPSLQQEFSLTKKRSSYRSASLHI